MNLTKNFTHDEMKCKCCGKMVVNRRALDRLQRVRDRFGPMTVSSGYRCPEHNAKVSRTGATGPHTTGRAFDILVEGWRAMELVTIAKEEGFTGVGVCQNGDHAGRFIHLDDLEPASGHSRPWMWSY